jgi:hypothetical protein
LINKLPYNREKGSYKSLHTDSIKKITCIQFLRQYYLDQVRGLACASQPLTRHPVGKTKLHAISYKKIGALSVSVYLELGKKLTGPNLMKAGYYFLA